MFVLLDHTPVGVDPSRAMGEHFTSPPLAGTTYASLIDAPAVVAFCCDSDPHRTDQLRQHCIGVAEVRLGVRHDYRDPRQGRGPSPPITVLEPSQMTFA